MNAAAAYQLGPRSVLRPGDRFRVGRGPTYRDGDGHEQSCALRGVFQLRGVVRRGKRIWLDAVRLDHGASAGTYLLYASGPAYWHRDIPGWRCRPYAVRKVRS